MNTKLLLKVKKHILAKPSRLRMSNWLLSNKIGTPYLRGKFLVDLDTAWGEPSRQRLPECGTVGCIAGWARMLEGSKGKPSDMSANILLNIFPSQSDQLFYVSGWPKKFADAYQKEGVTQRQRAKIVGQVIDDFIATDGWTKPAGA